MTHAKTSLEKYDAFRFDAGSLCLNFTATVRHRGSQPRDLIPTPAALEAWFQEAGLLTQAAQPMPEDVERAHRLRESIHRALCAIMMQQPLTSDDIDQINACAALPCSVPQLDLASGSVVWHAETPIQACLAAIAQDAVTILGTEKRHHVKVCAHAECQMLFIDHSPKKQRRWCSMSICGNREKVAAHRQRKTIDPS